MKKLSFLVRMALCVLIGFILSGCGNNIKGTDIVLSNLQNEKSTKTTSVTPPVMIEFDSMVDIENFILAANSPESQFYEYAEKHNVNKSVTYGAAQKFAENFAKGDNKVKIFCNKSDVSYDLFSGIYYTNTNVLDLLYKIENVSYRFVYAFDGSKLYQYEGEPVLQNVKVDSFEFDLYQGERALVGRVVDGETSIKISVFAEHIDVVNWAAFTVSTIDV